MDVPDLYWIEPFFDFETAVGNGSGVFHLILAGSGVFKCHTMFTSLDGLNGSSDETDSPFGDGDTPKVVIVGGGQSSITVAARLKHCSIPSP